MQRTFNRSENSVLVLHTWPLSWSRRRFRDCSMDLSISDFLSCRVSNRRSKCSLARRSASWPFSFKKKIIVINYTTQIKCLFHISLSQKAQMYNKHFFKRAEWYFFTRELRQDCQYSFFYCIQLWFSEMFVVFIVLKRRFDKQWIWTVKCFRI